MLSVVVIVESPRHPMHTRTLNYEICVKRRKILVFVVLSCTNKSVYAVQKWCLCKERLNNGEKKNWKRNRIEPKAKQWTLTWIRMGQWMAPSETGWMNEWTNERMKRCWNVAVVDIVVLMVMGCIDFMCICPMCRSEFGILEPVVEMSFHSI